MEPDRSQPKAVLNVGDKLPGGWTVSDVMYARKKSISAPPSPLPTPAREKEIDCPAWLAWLIAVSVMFVALKLIL